MFSSLAILSIFNNSSLRREGINSETVFRQNVTVLWQHIQIFLLQIILVSNIFSHKSSQPSPIYRLQDLRQQWPITPIPFQDLKSICNETQILNSAVERSQNFCSTTRLDNALFSRLRCSQNQIPLIFERTFLQHPLPLRKKKKRHKITFRCNISGALRDASAATATKSFLPKNAIKTAWFK